MIEILRKQFQYVISMETMGTIEITNTTKWHIGTAKDGKAAIFLDNRDLVSRAQKRQ